MGSKSKSPVVRTSKIDAETRRHAYHYALLPITRYLLRTAYCCILLTACYFLLSTHYALISNQYLLLATSYLLLATSHYYLLRTQHKVPLTIAVHYLQSGFVELSEMVYLAQEGVDTAAIVSLPVV